MKSFALIMLFLVGCGADREPLNVEASLADDLNLYLSVMPDQGMLGDLTVLKIGETPSGAVGFCNKKADGTREIHIYKYLKAGSYRTSVVFHELAHCLHDIPHVDSETSLMSEFPMIGNDYWDEHLATELKALPLLVRR